LNLLRTGSMTRAWLFTHQSRPDPLPENHVSLPKGKKETFRSFPDRDARDGEVRFTPKSRHRQLDPSRPKSANMRHHRFFLKWKKPPIKAASNSDWVWFNRSTDREMHHGKAARSVVWHVAGNGLTFLRPQRTHQRRLTWQADGVHDAEAFIRKPVSAVRGATLVSLRHSGADNRFQQSWSGPHGRILVDSCNARRTAGSTAARCRILLGTHNARHIPGAIEIIMTRIVGAATARVLAIRCGIHNARVARPAAKRGRISIR
jgi:hypothetical protein